MKKTQFLLVSLFFSLVIHAQTFNSFSVAGSSYPFVINCTIPSITLSAVSNYTGPVNYTWFDGTTSVSGPSLVVTTAVNYTVTGVANTVTLQYWAAVASNTTPPSSAVSPLGQAITCLGSPITVTAIASPANGIQHTFYSPNGGFFNSNTGTTFYSPSAPGTYTYVLTNLTNGCTSTKTLGVTSNDIYPAFTVGSPQNFSLGCGSQSLVSVVITTLSPAPLTYTLLNPGTVSYVPGSALSYTANAPGNYTVIVKNTSNGCESKVPLTITQNINLPYPSVSALTQTLSCYTQSVTLLSSTPGLNSTFIWLLPSSASVPGNSINVNTTAVISNTIIGNYTLVTTDLNNSCSTKSVITMYQNLFPPKAKILNTAGNLSCANPTIQLSNNSSTGVPPGTFFGTQGLIGLLWEGPAPQQPLANANAYQASAPGIYSLTVKDLNNGCLSSTTTVVGGYGVPQLIPSLFCTSTTSGSVVYVNSGYTGPQSGSTFYWSFPPTANVSGANTGTLLTNSTGVYTLTIFNGASSCSATALYTVEVCTGMDEVETTAFNANVYPNPNNGNFIVRSDPGHPLLNIEIYNAGGQLIKSLQNNGELTKVDLSDQAKGLYLIRISALHKTTQVTRVIKE